MHPLLVALVSFAVVMAAMAFLTAVFVVVRQVAGRLARSARAQETGGVSPELVVVLTAAASEALGTAVRLHRVHVHRGPLVDHWSRAGRMDIMISHRVEPKR
jgi:hypothetical protein